MLKANEKKQGHHNCLNQNLGTT